MKKCSKCSKCKIEKEYSFFGVLEKHQKMGILMFVKNVKF